MKTCPVCHAVAFDDAAICFGCMHRYDSREEPEGQPGSALEGEPCAPPSWPALPPAPSAAGVAATEGPPAFCIWLTPTAAQDGGVQWTCSVSMAG